MSLEEHFDATFATALALKEKQIQQSYRPIIGIHKWFARRPGTIFRSLLLAEFNGSEPIEKSYWRSHRFEGVIADPFMGGGTPIYEANRLGFHVVGSDINPMAYWIVRQALSALDPRELTAAAREVVTDVEKRVGELYLTDCLSCNSVAPVKYFLWVKTATCPDCKAENDLFPGYLLAEAERHPKHVVACAACGDLNEYESVPTLTAPKPCKTCGELVHIEGPARRQRVACRSCSTRFAYSGEGARRPPKHRLWAMEYHCARCKPGHVGRFFKRPDAKDLARVQRAHALWAGARDLPIPEDEIPAGDETARLHRWGYHRYREMFNERQLFGLGLLLQRIREVEPTHHRHALLTVFSDFLRYQNMLCRYDTYALKCQDIFSVHGFPVGLVQCENNLLGIPRVGSGSFRHFVEKYARAKAYCQAPFETRNGTGGKRRVHVRGESIEAQLTNRFPRGTQRQAYLRAAPAATIRLRARSLDGVFTDPPYFDNVQYAELMDFCFVWLRLALGEELHEFREQSTRSDSELTGNVTLGRDLAHFTAGLSDVFCRYAKALKPAAPFVFTYHHNDAKAYVPLIVSILDAGLNCTATLPAAAEMSASLHINGTGSSVLDSVFVCRKVLNRKTATDGAKSTKSLEGGLADDADSMRAAGLRVTRGDLRCLAAGRLARLAINGLAATWDSSRNLAERMQRATDALETITRKVDPDSVIAGLLDVHVIPRPVPHQSASLPGL